MAKRQKDSNNKKTMEDFAYRTVILSALMAGISFVISLLFNGEFVSITALNNTLILEIIENAIRILSILFFYIFIITSIGNYKELTGKPVTWIELSVFFIISLIQSFLDLLIFSFTFLGLVIVIIYFWIIQ
ncbi:MAG: hypothetical protein EU547_00220 [Promethearchaeota archaeon]|nr:MAG: hypothetical protein EU547_00220 [Candidatus Lokiarchaeota archaeon]